ncbi:hypothetical protein DFQ28_008236 [Apophysomyces sp. BC1034]|nr:hypothetical protein DFQ30_007775 [Apophysomyces sp. BC1015]KAG0175289.1 hypothetical protein DFQ29_007203 [Apophysomyces sp. BC1021]KAG0186168.1 hypothetical protein DFQ28_008236 [Apophysomyces sp. BC1034]
MKPNALHFLLLLVIAFASRNVSGQVGPNITSPEQNATIVAGQNLKIEYTYDNLGTGEYWVDIALWLDPTVKELLYVITENYKIPPGNSTGVSLNFTYNASFDWQVAHHLNETVYLTVREKVNTTFFPDVQIRSPPIMLHVSAAAYLPAPYFITILLSLVVICISSF